MITKNNLVKDQKMERPQFWFRIKEIIGQGKNEEGLLIDNYRVEITSIEAKEPSYHIHVEDIIVLQIEEKKNGSKRNRLAHHIDYLISGGKFQTYSEPLGKFYSIHSAIQWKYFTNFDCISEAEIEVKESNDFSPEKHYKEYEKKIKDCIVSEKNSLQSIVVSHDSQIREEIDHKIEVIQKRDFALLNQEMEQFTCSEAEIIQRIQAEFDSKSLLLKQDILRLEEFRDIIKRESQELEEKKQLFEKEKKQDINKMILSFLSYYQLDPNSIKAIRIDIEELLEGRLSILWAKK